MRLAGIIIIWLLAPPWTLGKLHFGAEVFYDPGVASIGTRETIGWLYKNGLRMSLGSSYRFDKNYEIDDTNYYTNELLTELVLGWQIPILGLFQLEPFGALHFSNWYYETDTERYIEQWDRQTEWGAKVLIAPVPEQRRWQIQPFFRWSQKSGLFSGDATDSFGMGVDFALGKKPEPDPMLLAANGEDPPQYRAINGYFVLLVFYDQPDGQDLEPRLLNPNVQKYMKQDEGIYLLYLGPFKSKVAANNQRNLLGLHRARQARIVFGTIGKMPIEVEAEEEAADKDKKKK